MESDNNNHSETNLAFTGIKARLPWLTFIGAAALMLLFALFACKNISYPLLWNDESETAMTAQQVIKCGYPKVHDEKNTVFMADNPLLLGYKAKGDANISIPWGNYYFGTIGVWLAGFTNDIYQKTALVRLPFVLAGFLGLLIFAFSMRRFFLNSTSFRIFLMAYLLLEMLSVNLLLHIREARYYSLVILVTACYFYVFSAFHFHRNFSRRNYFGWLTVTLFAAFNINFVAFVSICATTAIYQCLAYINHKTGKRGSLFAFNFKETLVLTAPLLLSAALITPELIFFETFNTAHLAGLYYKAGTTGFINHCKDIFTIMCTYDLLPAAIVIKTLRLGLGTGIKKRHPYLSNRTHALQQLSLFTFLFFAIYALAAASMPFLFTRYFIVLQPTAVFILLTDVLILLDYVALLPAHLRFSRVFVAITAGAICLGNLLISTNHLSDYFYQISHPYKGPLDYYIPAIKSRFPKPENIVLATNYEELSYEYYLGCKVILGYQNHFQSFNDSALQQYSPDVIIIRPGWPQDNKPYTYYLQHGHYQKISFPVQDWPVNNVADLYFYLNHRFKTQTTEVESEKAYMYIKTTI